MYLSIDPNRCTGCLACQVYCSLSHEGEVNVGLARITLLRARDQAGYLVLACVPCEAKSCLEACLEPGAIYVDEIGAVTINEALCTGCSQCVGACPIGGITFHRLIGRGKHGKAVALKCDLCGGDPWCARVCSSQAIVLVREREGAQNAQDRLREICNRWLEAQMETNPGRRKG